MHLRSKEAVLKCFSEGPKVAKKQKQTHGNNGKASNATQRSLKESFAAAGPKFTQAHRQDSVTRGAETNFGEAREIYLCEFEGGRTSLFATKKKDLQHKYFHKFWLYSQNFCNSP